jgi:S1-C subfamily serine protease
VNALDLLVVLLVVSAVLGGWRLGLLARALSWLGLAAGLTLAARLLPSIVRAFPESDPTARLFGAAGVLLAGALVGQALGILLGARFRRFLPFGPARIADRTLGAFAGLVGVIVAIWFMLPAMAGVPGWPARQARNSVIARLIDDLAPPAPDTLQALRRLVGEDQFPQVFSELTPAQDTGPPPVDSGLPPEIQQRVAASTVKISGIACRRIQEGSGFTAGPGIVVTNAHVVAGQDDTDVVRSDGRRRRAEVAVFDPDRDIAVLRVAGLDQPALVIGAGRVGATGAVFGHPRGQRNVRASPAAIRQEIEAVGRDLYDAHETRREVYVLAAQLHPGDSGGPLVDGGGAVVGVAFAIAPDRPDTSYALTEKELSAVLARNRAGTADTGPCLNH